MSDFTHNDLLSQISREICNQLTFSGYPDIEMIFFPDGENPRETKTVISSKKSHKATTFKPQLAIDLEEVHGYDDGVLELFNILLSEWNKEIV